MANVFDQFDSPQGSAGSPSANVFDQFDAPKADHGALSAGAQGAANTLSFGLHPAMRGLMTAAGEAPDAPASVGSMLKGGAKLFHENVVKPILGQDSGGLAGQITGRQPRRGDESL